AEQRYGYSKAEFLGMTALDIRPAEDRARFSASTREALGSIRLTAEWRHCKKDGTVMDVEVSFREVIFEGRPALLALAIDVSARKRAESALRESEERFRQIAEHIQEVFFLSELQSGRVIYLNPAFERLWGVPA